jgi:hypothetical protein
LGGNKQNWDGFLKIAVPVFRLPNGTAKHAKFSDLLGDLTSICHANRARRRTPPDLPSKSQVGAGECRVLRGAKLLSDMNLRRPCRTGKYREIQAACFPPGGFAGRL